MVSHRTKEIKDNSRCSLNSYCTIISLSLISALMIFSHLYNLIFIISNKAYSHPLIPVSASVFILNIIFLVLLIEKRRFSIPYGTFVYSYGIFLSISLFVLNRLNMAGFLINLSICVFVVICLNKSKSVKKALIY